MSMLLRDSFAYPDGVITNEFATRNPGKRGIHTSAIWLATSGTLFAKSGQGLSGNPPDHKKPDIDSVEGNNSAVYRVITHRTDFRDVVVQFDLTFVRLVSTPGTPPKDYDGVHVFLRRRGGSEHAYSTYYLSVFRRDGTSIIKRKPSPRNDNYLSLCPPVHHRVSPGTVLKKVQAFIRNERDGSVKLKLSVNNRKIVEVVDSMAAGPILHPGAVGIRGDNCEFRLDNFEVHSVA
jgi:hypothetical protein